jgi:hypothetical protein
MTTTATGNPITCNCKGTGRYTIHDEDGIRGSLSTHLCPCRLELPLRHGDARWWSSESVKDMEFESATKFDTVTSNASGP